VNKQGREVCIQLLDERLFFFSHVITNHEQHAIVYLPFQKFFNENANVKTSSNY